MNPTWQGHRAKAFTLAEALIASALLAASISAITLPFSAAAHNQQDEARRTVAVSLAQEMLEEILSKPFRDPNGASACGPESGETSRSLFDNMDDYDGYFEPAGQIVGLDGQKVTTSASTGLTRSVSATYVYLSGQDTGKPPSYLRIVVTIGYRGQTEVRLTRLAYDLN